MRAPCQRPFPRASRNARHLSESPSLLYLDHLLTSDKGTDPGDTAQAVRMAQDGVSSLSPAFP